MKKKGQITIYVLLGLVLITATGLLLYAEKQTLNTQLEEELDFDKFPETFNEFTENCAKKAAEYELEKMFEDTYVDSDFEYDTYQNEPILVAFDYENPFLITPKTEFSNEIMEASIKNGLEVCLSELLIYDQTPFFEMYLEEFKTQLLGPGLVVDYTYELHIEEEIYRQENRVVAASERAANAKILESFIKEYEIHYSDDTDSFYNMLECNRAYARYGVKPLYDLGFMAYLPEDSEVTLEENRFIISAGETEPVLALFKPYLKNEPDC